MSEKGMKGNTNSRKKSKTKPKTKTKKTTSKQKSVPKNKEKKRRKNINLAELTKEELLKFIDDLMEKHKKEIKAIKTKGGIVAAATLTAGTVLGVVNSETVKESVLNVNPFGASCRTATGFDPETGEPFFGYVKERNKEKNTTTVAIPEDGKGFKDLELDSGNVSEGVLMRFDELKNNVIHKYIVPEGAKAYLRTGEMKTKDNIITELQPGDVLYGGNPIFTSNGKIAYIPTKDGTFVLFLDEIEQQPEKNNDIDELVLQAVAKKDMEVYANPDDNEIIKAYVKKGTKVNVLKNTWENPAGDLDVPVIDGIIDRIISGKVEICDESGKVIGWVKKLDLEEIDINKLVEEEKYKKAIERFENTKFSLDGQVLGIDSRDMTADTLRNILTSYTMPSSLEKDGEVYNTSAFEGCNVGFVNIRCGASGYGEAMAPIDPDFIPLCQVCEECNRPYTVYYFSTSCTLDEAIGESKGTENEDKKSERERIRNELEEMKSNNLEPRAIIINKELASENNGGRMQGKDVTEITAALMIWVEKDAKDIFGKNIPVLLYTSEREVNSEEKIIDLPNLKDLLGHKVPVWVPEITNKNGLINDTGYFRGLEEGGIVDVYMTQFKQDFKMPTEIDNDDVAYDFNSIPMSRYADTMLGVPLSDILLPRDESSQEKMDNDFIQDILKKIDKRRANLSEPEATEQGDEIGQ